MATITLPQSYNIVVATPPTTTNATVTYDNVSVKNALGVWLIANYKQAASHQTVITPKLGATVASCTTAITFAAKWWLNSDIATSDALVAQTAATTFTLAAGTTDQLVVAYFNLSDMYSQGATFDCIGATSATSSQATNFVSALWLLETRFAQATPYSAIID